MQKQQKKYIVERLIEIFETENKHSKKWFIFFGILMISFFLSHGIMYISHNISLILFSIVYVIVSLFMFYTYFKKFNK